ncbi:nuclear transport factor 2 family protein [Streptacidiphilus jiangxiensis]|uniref:SnoaL-like domain-containing protein n=1 Tax=Streptacidiphilus jiangxiensis TaxID=235985 RepID=A0A1H7TCA9_STRJI|nr:nuclear transport factor 2 family protein [Streptacidiphilus jiangxiensis]SEL82502.1 SnoaL-like domain-containing protein [Streptacidiphilus jiangxiensis]
MSKELPADDAERIRQLLARFAHVFDDRESQELGEVFSDDAVIELTGSGRTYRGLAEIRAFHRDLGAGAPDHHTVDTLLLPQDDGTVHARSRYLALLPDGGVHNGEYRDVLVTTADGWRIALRRSIPHFPVFG